MNAILAIILSIVVLGRSSKRNRKSNILAAIDRDKSKAKCDFDRTFFRCCTISLARYQAISPVCIVQRSRRSMEREDNPRRVRSRTFRHRPLRRQTFRCWRCKRRRRRQRQRQRNTAILITLQVHRQISIFLFADDVGA